MSSPSPNQGKPATIDLKFRLRSLLKRGWKPALTVVILTLIAIFAQREGPQLARALRQIPQTPLWVAVLATAVTILYVLCSGLM